MIARIVYGGGMARIPVKAVNVMCPDGNRRAVDLDHKHDDFLGMSGKVRVGKRAARGYITHYDDDLIFVATGRDGAVFGGNPRP